MQKHLNRNKDKYNPYTLDIDEETNTYIVEFKDTKNIIHKSINASISDEDEVEYKLLSEDLKSAINKLNDIQKRRIQKYFFENKTYEEIASEENCSKVAVKYSIDIALEKISKKIKI